jgi:hypothetical protein
VAGGTAEYWKRRVWRRARPGQSNPFSLAIPKAFRNEAVSLTASEDDLAGPLYADSDSGSANKVLTRPRDTRELAGGGTLTVLTGSVRDWSVDQLGVMATFEADWLTRRGFGSCYLRLPGLVGEDSISPAQQTHNRVFPNQLAAERSGKVKPGDLLIHDPRTGQVVVYEPRLQPLRGSTTVKVENGSVDVGASLPSPNRDFDGHPKWTCKATQLSRKDYKSLPAQDLERKHASTCAALAVIEEDVARTQRDILLLMLGALFSFTGSIAVAVWFDWLARRRDVTQNQAN